MFNLIKFESLKLKTKGIAFGVLVVLIQVYFIFSHFTDTKRAEDTLGGMVLFSLISYVIYVFSGVISLSKDINSQDRFVSYMLPVSGFRIALSKFLTLMSIGIFLVIFTVLWFLSNAYFIDKVGLIEGLIHLNKIELFNISLVIISSIGSFFALAFLSMLIVKTLLSKLKFKIIVAVIVMSVISKIWNLFFFDNLQSITSTNQILHVIVINLATLAMLWVSGWLIDNKTDF